MNEQEKSPGANRGFDNSRGGERLVSLCRELLAKSNRGRMAWSKPILLQMTPEKHFFKVLCDGRTNWRTGKGEWEPGRGLHIYELVDAARRANETGSILNIGIIGDGFLVGGNAPSMDSAEAWLRGEAGA